MTKYRTELNAVLSSYMQRIIELNKRFHLYNATKELREMYHPAILDEANNEANVANRGVETAYNNYMLRLENYYTLAGSKIDEQDIMLLNPTIFHLTQWEFNKLWDKHSGNSTMEAALRSYAETSGLLFEKEILTMQQKEELASQVKNAALNDIRRNTVYELIDWCVEMQGELYREAEQLKE